MAGELERLLIRIEADTALLRKELDAADKRVGAFGDSIDKQLSRSERRFSSFSAASSRILGGLAVGYLVKETVQLADTYTNMANRLKFVTSSAEELASVQARLFQIAQSTRQDLAGVTELYARMAFALRDTGASQEQLLKFTENLNKALALSGASGAEASGALIQLSQGLASGTLRGQELNSVLEQTPYLAALIAKQMGVTTGELRKLGEQGKITGAEVFNAITGASGELDRKFAETVPTVSQGFTRISNSLLNFVGHVNETTEASRGLARILQQIADAIDTIADTVDKVGPALRFMMPEGSTGQDAFGKFTMGDARTLLGGRSASITPDDAGATQPLQSKSVDQFTQVEKQLEQLRIRALEAQNLQTEAMQAQHALELQQYQSMLEQKLITLEQFNAASENLQTIANRRQMDAQSRLSDALLSQLSATGQAAFGENKKWAIAEAAISTYQGVAKALGAYPPPYNFAMAALVAAQGFAQVAAIRSTSGGSAGGGASVSGGSVASSSSPSTQSAGSAGSTDGGRAIGITLVGRTFDREQIRELVEGLNGYLADGGRLYVK